MQPEMLVLKPSEMCESGSRTCKKVQIEVDRSQDQFFLVERSGHESTVEMGNPLQMEVFYGNRFYIAMFDYNMYFHILWERICK